MSEPLGRFPVGRIEVEVLPHTTPEGSKPFARLSQEAERNGTRLDQRFDIDGERTLEVAGRARELVSEYQQQGFFSRLASKVSEAIKGKPDRHHLGSFSIDRLSVDVFARNTEEGVKPYVVLSEEKRQPGPRGKVKKQSFAMEVKRLEELSEKVRPILVAEQEKERAKQEEQNRPKWWLVVRIEKTLETGAIVRVVGCHNDRVKAELQALWSPSFVFPQSYPTKRFYGDRLVVGGGEDPKIDARIKEFKVMEEYHRRHAPVNLSAEAITAERRGDIRPVKQVFRDDMVAQAFDIRGRDGKWYSRVSVTRPVKDQHGTTRMATVEMSREQFKAVLKRAEERQKSPKVSRGPDETSPPVKSFTVGDLHVDLINRQVDGKPKEAMVLTRTTIGPDGTPQQNSVECSREELKHVLGQLREPKQAKGQEEAVSPKGAVAQEAQKEETRAAQPAQDGPKIAPKSEEPALGKPAQTEERSQKETPPPAGLEEAIKQAMDRGGRHFAAALWVGPGRPEKEDRVTYKSSIRCSQGEDGTWQFTESQAKAIPVNGPRAQGTPDRAYYVGLERTEVDGVYRVIGRSPKKRAVENRVEELEQERKAEAREKLSEMQQARPVEPQPQPKQHQNGAAQAEQPSQTKQPVMYHDYWKRLNDEDRQHTVMGRWYGASPPQKGQAVYLETGLRWDHDAAPGQKFKEGEAKIVPANDPRIEGEPKAQLYVIAVRWKDTLWVADVARSPKEAQSKLTEIDGERLDRSERYYEAWKIYDEMKKTGNLEQIVSAKRALEKAEQAFGPEMPPPGFKAVIGLIPDRDQEQRHQDGRPIHF